MSTSSTQLSGQISAAGSAGDWLRLVQDKSTWDAEPKTNYGFNQYLLEEGFYNMGADNVVDPNILYQQLHEAYYGPCGGGGGTLLFGYKVIKGREDLDYNLDEGYGRFKSNGTKEVETVVRLEVSGEDSVTIDEHRVVKLESPVKYSPYPGIWESNPRDLMGNKVRRPDGGTWDADTQTITFDQKMYGTFRVHMIEIFDSWTLTVWPRTNLPQSLIYDLEAIYGSTQRCFYEGGVEQHELEIPDEAADCVQYYEYTDPVTGEVKKGIRPGTGGGPDLDGDGQPDGGGEGDCFCWYCNGTTVIEDCTPSTTVDCTCPYCIDGVLIDCEESDSEGGDDDGGGSHAGGQSDGAGTCYELLETRERCTDELVGQPTLVKVPCPDEPEKPTTTPPPP